MPTTQPYDSACTAKSIFIIQDAKADEHVKHLMQMMANGCAEHVTMLPCEGAWIWDPYGSFVRTVLFLAQKQHIPPEIWVMAASGPNQRFQLTAPLEKRDMLRTTSYMLQHVFHVHPTQWLTAQPDADHCVRSTVHLLRTHPMLPAQVRVVGYVFDAAANGFVEVPCEADES